MGAKDIVTKDYTDDSRIFADAFNQLIHKGERVIKPENLKPLDTTMIGVPYGADGVGVPIQKFRDSLKYLTTMEDDNIVYHLLGIENQSEVHYAMPVKDMLYDALQYAGQVEKAAKSHRKAMETAKQSGGTSEEIPKVTGGEYLSGFYKDDRLIPVITLVIYFGAGEWDGPITLHDMMAVQDPKILSFVSDYKINLIAPCNLSDEEIDRFKTSLREVMLFIKYSKDKDKLNELLQKDEGFRNVERKAARVIRTITGSNVKLRDEEEDVNMCQAIQEMMEDAEKKALQEERVSTAKKMLAKKKFSYEEIAELLTLTVEEVQALDEEKLE